MDTPTTSLENDVSYVQWIAKMSNEEWWNHIKDRPTMTQVLNCYGWEGEERKTSKALQQQIEARRRTIRHEDIEEPEYIRRRRLNKQVAKERQQIVQLVEERIPMRITKKLERRLYASKRPTKIKHGKKKEKVFVKDNLSMALLEEELRKRKVKEEEAFKMKTFLFAFNSSVLLSEMKIQECQNKDKTPHKIVFYQVKGEERKKARENHLAQVNANKESWDKLREELEAKWKNERLKYMEEEDTENQQPKSVKIPTKTRKSKKESKKVGSNTQTLNQDIVEDSKYEQQQVVYDPEIDTVLQSLSSKEEKGGTLEVDFATQATKKRVRKVPRKIKSGALEDPLTRKRELKEERQVPELPIKAEVDEKIFQELESVLLKDISIKQQIINSPKLDINIEVNEKQLKKKVLKEKLEALRQKRIAEIIIAEAKVQEQITERKYQSKLGIKIEKEDSDSNEENGSSVDSFNDTNWSISQTSLDDLQIEQPALNVCNEKRDDIEPEIGITTENKPQREFIDFTALGSTEKSDDLEQKVDEVTVKKSLGECIDKCALGNCSEKIDDIVQKAESKCNAEYIDFTLLAAYTDKTGDIEPEVGAVVSYSYSADTAFAERISDIETQVGVNTENNKWDDESLDCSADAAFTESAGYFEQQVHVNTEKKWKDKCTDFPAVTAYIEKKYAIKPEPGVVTDNKWDDESLDFLPLVYIDKIVDIEPQVGGVTEWDDECIDFPALDYYTGCCVKVEEQSQISDLSLDIEKIEKWLESESD